MQFEYSILVVFATVLGVLGKLQCPSGYNTTDNRRCYKVIRSSSNRTTAANFCKREGGFLASVPNQKNDIFLETLMRERKVDSAWLGITCSTRESCQNDDRTAFQIEDKTPYTNKNTTDLTKSYYLGKRCVYKRLNGWIYTGACEETELSFICELAVENVFTDSQCLDGYETPDNRMCYKVDTVPRTRDDANNRCALDGGHLASIPNEFTFYYLSNITEHVFGSWLWVGMTCNGTLESCKNEDGTAVTLKHSYFERKFYSPCVVFVSYADLFTRSCEDAHPFICGMPVGNLCRPGYFFSRGSCYALKTDFADNQMDAENNCRKDKGHLASINDDEENNFIFTVALAKKSNVSYSLVRIGLQSPSESQYYWTDGSAVNYTRIDYLKPALGSCFALSLSSPLSSTGNWSRTNCVSNLPYVCKTGTTYEDQKLLAPLLCNATTEFSGSGTAYSPGYPLAYARNNCFYLITVDMGQKVEIEFTMLTLVKGATITVYDDLSEGKPIIVLDYNSKNVNTITSSYQQMSVFFKSDEDVATPHTGWIMKYGPAMSTSNGKKN